MARHANYQNKRPVHADIVVNGSTDALFAVGIAADALANSVGVAIEAGYKKDVIGEKISQPLLRYSDRAGRFGRITLDRCNTSHFAARLVVMPAHPNADKRDPDILKENIEAALRRLDAAAEQRVADQKAWDFANPCGNDEARRERLADMKRINAQEMVQRAKLRARLNGRT